MSDANVTPPSAPHGCDVQDPAVGTPAADNDVHATIGVIGGSRFHSWLSDAFEVTVDTPFGPPSDPPLLGQVAGRRVAFLPRHERHEQGRRHGWCRPTVSVGLGTGEGDGRVLAWNGSGTKGWR